MPFKDLLAQAKSRAEGFAQQHGSHRSPQSAPGYNAAGPPPIPVNKPSFQPIQSYWAASFHPETPVSQNFKHQFGDHGWGNNELQNYISDSTNSFHVDNKLIVRAIASQGKYTSARLTSHSKLGRPRGCLSFVATIPHAIGVWPAIWLLPSEPFQWPNEGEIDILETWNGDMINHSCLHWGHHNGEDHDKHRVVETPIRSTNGTASTHQYEFVWDESGNGRLLWYIDGRPVMKALKPGGTRAMVDWQIIINVAMGGDVCQGRTPGDDQYDLVVHSLSLSDGPRGGWRSFERDWQTTVEGHT